MKRSNHVKMFLGFAIGGFLGIMANLFFGGNPNLEFIIKNVAEPVGQIFLRTMIMVVIPMVFASLALGVAGFGDLKKLGRIGAKTFAMFMISTFMASIIGLLLVNTIKPGAGLSPELKERLMSTYKEDLKKNLDKADKVKFDISLFLNIIPKNPIKAAADGDMLAVIFFSLMLGIALTRIHRDKAQPFIAFLSALAESMIAIINIALKMAPVGVGALIFSVTARFGIDLIIKLIWYVMTVVSGLAIQLFVVYSVYLIFFVGYNPLHFFKTIEGILLTAFSTSSSNATLPTTLKVTEEELGIPNDICSFVLPLGSTVNMNGTALFEGVTVLFLAQVFGVELSLGSQIIVTFMAVLTAVGTAGVPGGSIPLMIMVLQMVGVPGEGIALILGVDRFLDMCRTTVNVAGDVVTAVAVARSEGVTFPLRNRFPPVSLPE
ncbi:MAG: dicarboxylate/amino acid:cation symporter [Candidatus Riflebacteria bacterium]|nr:dicarboxylate/amino acid:cation symporter [Candidatus Riflebacteria bacterium]